ncbi:NAD-dependent epimerase/dehydratase family protein [Aquipuribacter nitratireducens]|uniref:NAD-dependent epimerase/dehydratase family protein n=1 Tax=Aquipuribacter nitratireducens TaxID=650104 RepID=A0ABW0GKK3_9MICO
MVVAVTGGSGKLGRAVVADLVAHGEDVVVLDRVVPALPTAGPGSAVAVRTDLTDYGQVLGALAGVDERHDGVDAVVHLAAVPAPGLVPNAALFTNNVPSTFHVFEAARTLGVRRVVWASSETVLGLPFDTPPPYAPVDEAYAPRPESTYSLGKVLEEELARQHARWRSDATFVGLRFSNVMDVADYAGFEAWQDDPSVRRWNLWGYIDARDGAQATRRALTADVDGAAVAIVANADTVMRRSSAELMAAEFPGVEVRGDLGEHETLLSIGTARRLLGYDPQHSWRDHVGAGAEEDVPAAGHS